MSIIPKSRDGRTALLIVVGSFVTAITLWVGFFAFTGYLVDAGDRAVSQTQTD
ncbi:hypothetical protein [Microbacterium sp. R86528]|uniref:hypothetical protein n=1 Tax=Microbacterium sp. R86528 TaxID=3093864 RepID=UPI0037C5ECE4